MPRYGPDEAQDEAKLAPRWRYVGQLGAQDGQLGIILGGILGHISDLARDLSKNNRSVKRTILQHFWWFFEGRELVRGSFENCFGRCWLQDRIFEIILG